MNSPPQMPISSLPSPYYTTNETASPSTFNRISPALVLIIVILAVIFFIYGLLHLLVRLLMKRPSFSAVYQSNRYSESSGAHTFQRQLQQLFKLHDSGLDQAFIDALPVFYYKDVVGLKEPFDCPVCLSEFCYHDKLRLLPKCSHAFHINCIDTWLLSNSTCPLCRGALLSSGPPMENPTVDYRTNRELSIGMSSEGENRLPSGSESATEDTAGEMRVLSVRLGKFRRLNNESNGDKEQGESSSSNLDARRCYSMGAFQYVLVDSDLQVALNTDFGPNRNAKLFNINENNADSSANWAMEGRKISGRTRGDSFSVSKIWLWSKKSKFPSSLNSHGGTHPIPLSWQTNERTESSMDAV